MHEIPQHSTLGYELPSAALPAVCRKKKDNQGTRNKHVAKQHAQAQHRHGCKQAYTNTRRHLRNNRHFCQLTDPWLANQC
jgi:hypothetical protein